MPKNPDRNRQARRAGGSPYDQQRARMDREPVQEHTRPVHVQIIPKTPGQQEYLKMLRDKDVVFGIGPAGTGKTHMAVCEAARALEKGYVQRVVLTRPAVEAGGEKLGYLPGKMDEKVAPYLIPLFDSLYKALGRGRVDCHIRNGKIEIAPLAFMRGRTLEDAYVILDEAQNCTFDQLMMLLTRMGEGSRCVLTGDASQVDLEEKESGLLAMIRALRGVQGVGVYELKSSDVVRHPLVASIIDAVEAYNKGLRRIG